MTWACIKKCVQFNTGLIGYLNWTLSWTDWPPSDICYIFNHYSALPYRESAQLHLRMHAIMTAAEMDRECAWHYTKGKQQQQQQLVIVVERWKKGRKKGLFSLEKIDALMQLSGRKHAWMHPRRSYDILWSESDKIMESILLWSWLI
jgi:hypothetical protein